jgi:hypothetical protein
MRNDPAQSQFEMTSRAALDEAAEWLQDLGYRLHMNDGSPLRPGRASLVVFHSADSARDVRRVIHLVDPRALERRPAAPRP